MFQVNNMNIYHHPLIYRLYQVTYILQIQWENDER